MKKKTKIIIFIIALLIVLLIPIGISAAKGLAIHFKSDEEIAEANKKENERALAEKENFAKTHQANGISTQVDNSEQNNNIPLLDENLAKADEEEQKFIEIIKKYYPNEFEKILEESKTEQDTGIVEITSSPLKDYEKKLYDLVLKILENENLTEEESNILKQYIHNNMYNIKKDNSLNDRAEKILNT